MKHIQFILALALLLGACATPPAPPRSAESYLQEGQEHFDKGSYEDAIAAWEKARETFQSPELNLAAEFNIAEAYLISESYPEAEAAYEDFLKQHPESDKSASAQYGLAMSYYHQQLTIDRDQAATRKALAAFETLAAKFPEDPRIEEARTLMAECRDRLAAHELYVGRFYVRTKKYQAAANRLEELFKRYPNFSERDEAYFLLGQAYLRMGDRSSASRVFDDLNDGFPGSDYALSAQKLLNKAD